MALPPLPAPRARAVTEAGPRARRPRADAAPVPGPRAIAYQRVSTAEQRESGLGLAAQQAQIAHAAARLGLALAATHTDAGLSGSLPLEARPALLAALDALRPGDSLIVAKRDRLGRDVLNVALIERLVARRGAKVYSAAGEGSDDEGPTGLLMRQIVDAFSQYERSVIAHRTTAALAAKRARGEVVGHVPYGSQRVGARLVPHAGEQAILRQVWTLRRSGARVTEIATTLNQQGVRTRRGTEWSRQVVAQLLARHPDAV